MGRRSARTPRRLLRSPFATRAMDLSEEQIGQLSMRLKADHKSGSAPQRHMVQASVLFARGASAAQAATSVEPNIPKGGSRTNISKYGEIIKSLPLEMWHQASAADAQPTQPTQSIEQSQ